MTALRRFLHAVIGDLRWQPPPWIRFLGRPLVAANGLRKREPRRFWTVAVALLVVLGGGYGLYRYIANLPKPEYLTATVTDPKPTKIEPDAKPDPLRISFSGAAAPLERVGKVVTTDFSVTPAVDGSWQWENDRTLVFTPAAEWPVGQDYRLTFKPGFLAPQARMEQPRIDFHSPPITVEVADQSFWEDPTDPKNKRVAVTFKFSHVVDKAALEKRLALRMRVEPEEAFDGPASRSLGFKVSYDDTGAKAFIQSEPIAIPPERGAVQVTLDSGVPAARGGRGTKGPAQAVVYVPGLETYFHVDEVNLSVVTNDDTHRMEHVASLWFTATVKADEIAKSVTVWELPVDRPAVGDAPVVQNFAWDDPAQVTPEVLAAARKLDVTWLPSEDEWAKRQSFRFDAAGGRALFVRVEKGATSFGGFALAKAYTAVLEVDEFPQSVEIMHDGAVLALSGNRKLSVLARNLEAVEIEISRLLPASIAHFTSQTSGPFEAPEFNGYGFELDNLSEVFREVRPLAQVAPGDPQYEAIDFGRFLSNGAPPRGLFQLRISGWDPDSNERIDGVEAKRIVLVTDLGFLVKDALDGSHDVFVMSIASGQPVADAEVQVLGKNGLPVLTRTTDASGRASFPQTKDFKREKSPVAYVVQKAGDLSFLPYNRRDRRLDLSRFDTGGLSDDKELESLQAYLFSDRGVYRPGEEATIGVIVKRIDWTPLPDGLPLEIVVDDARDRTIRSETLTMPADGFRDFRFQTQASSPTGIYRIQLYIVRDGRRGELLGQTSVRVEEFLPDRMTITSTLSPANAAGWVSPADLRAHVALRNLIGTPAVGNRIKATLRLSPSLPSFARWPGWNFYDPMAAQQSFDETLAELQTDDAGEADFDLHLERFEKATYRLRFVAEGFEAEGNRSVASDATALVSPLPYLVAWKADGDLGWVKRDTARAVQVVAVGSDLEPIETNEVSAELIEITYVRVLAREESGLLSYQSVKKEIARGSHTLALGRAPLSLTLPTAQAGHFAYVLKDAAGTEINRIGFDVVGEGNVAGRVEHDAELKVRLAKADYAPGDDIEVAIAAPYSGAGLITIERDRVYAATWFKTDGNSTVQHIRLPEALEGNGYVVVSFVRDLASRDIFVSPLTSGAAPFSVSRTRHTQDLTLNVPERVAPGTTLHIGWNAGAPTHLAVLAVDEGILQVARWKTPDPLSYFFRKRSLAVTTAQILDLLLPEYEIVRSLAAPGGDEDALLAGNLNPFKRKGIPPVAYWSGILDVPAGAGGVDYAIPDTFNGSLRVLAVGVNDRAVGIAETRTIARGPFVILPTLPTFAAPGDEIDITALITNTVEGSGPSASVQATLEVSPGLEIVGNAVQTMTIAEGRDAVARWHLRVGGHPGVATATFRVASGEHAATSTLDMSVRPAAPALTTVATQVLPHGGSKDIAVDRMLYPELRQVDASAATSPLGLIPGLARYLAAYPHGCSEQLVSAAFPALLLGAHPEFGIDAERAKALTQRVLLTLQARQNGDGAFGLWDADGHTDDFITAYATHYLIEARARGQAVPDAMLRRALEYLAGNLDAEGELPALRAKSYGLYLLTRSGQVKLDEARALRDALLALPEEERQGDLAALFLAAVFKQLHLDDDTRALIDSAGLGRVVASDYDNYYDPLTADGFTIYILAKHFPERLRALPPDALLKVGDEIAKFNTLSAGALILGLDAYSQAMPPAAGQQVQIAAVNAAGVATSLTTEGAIVLRAAVPEDAKQVRFSAASGAPLFQQLVQSGFDREPPKEKVANGLEVSREIRAAGGDAAVTTTSVRGKLDVVLYVRSTEPLTRQVAVVDLLPGGFEVDLTSDSLAQRKSLVAADDAWEPDYVDVREDRVVLYGTVGTRAQRFVYRIKPTNRGHFQIPPVLIEGMYDRAAWGRGLGSAIDVTD